LNRILLLNYLITNVFALVILLLLYINVHRPKHNYHLEERLFIYMLSSTALLMILDTSGSFLDGNPAPWAYPVNLLVVMVYYSLNALPCMLWSLYADNLIHHKNERTARLWLPLSIPAILLLLLNLVSPFTSWIFHIDAANVYHRGTLFPLLPVICYSYLISSLIQIKLNKSRLNIDEYVALLVFGIPPTLCGVLQVLFPKLSLVWISLTFSLLVIYLYVQNKQLNIDHLTGLYNRRQLEAFLSDHENTTDPGRMLAGIMIDLDGFKKINDIYGHDAGDHALGEASRILRESLRREDFISRYGGDEFTVFAEINRAEALDRTVTRIKENLTSFNSSSGLPYQLSFSMGYDIYNPALGISLQQFVKHIDQKMYEDKQSKK